MRSYLSLLCCLVWLISCNEKIDLIGDYKETAVVYGLLDQSDSLHYIKITRAFIGPGNAVNIAKIPDSSYFQNVDARIKEFVGGDLKRTWILKDTVVSGKNSNGAFYDKSNNRWIPSNIGGRIATFNFRPTQIQIVKTRDPKFPNDPSKATYKKYAVGQVYRGTSDEATSLGELLGDDIDPQVRENWNKTYTVAVPLEGTGVSGLISRDKRNDLTLFNQKYEELTKGETAKKQQGATMTPAQWNKKWATLKSGESMVGLDGKTYTKK